MLEELKGMAVCRLQLPLYCMMSRTPCTNFIMALSEASPLVARFKMSALSSWPGQNRRFKEGARKGTCRRCGACQLWWVNRWEAELLTRKMASVLRQAIRSRALKCWSSGSNWPKVSPAMAGVMGVDVTLPENDANDTMVQSPMQ